MLDKAVLRELFEDSVKRSGAVGAQLSVITADEQVDLVAGLAHARRELAMTPATLMQVGSVTKVFNAAIVVSLAEEGMLDIDAPVGSYIPNFEVADRHVSRVLTPRHLLSMSSGLDNGPYVYFGGAEDALSRYVDHLRTVPQHFPPGRFFGYSNAGACIAGYVASRVAGKPWETLLRERILEPAGLSCSAVLDADVLYQSVSAGHFPLPNGQVNIIDPIFTMGRARAPSGRTMALSAGDLARFGKIFVNGGKADTGARVLSEASVRLMMTPQIEVPTRKFGSAWCMGPYSGNWNGVQVWGHGGTSLTSAAFLHWFPEQRGVLAFIVNTHAAMSEFAESAFGEIMRAAFGFCKPRIDVPQESLGPVDLRRYVGVYEELGMRMYVTQEEGSTLKARLVPKPTGYELGVAREQLATLTALGSDRFLLNPAEGLDKHRGLVDLAFFGNDEEGRATHALNLVFPMTRVTI